MPKVKIKTEAVISMGEKLLPDDNGSLSLKNFDDVNRDEHLKWRLLSLSMLVENKPFYDEFEALTKKFTGHDIKEGLKILKIFNDYTKTGPAKGINP